MRSGINHLWYLRSFGQCPKYSTYDVLPVYFAHRAAGVTRGYIEPTQDSHLEIPEELEVEQWHTDRTCLSMLQQKQFTFSTTLIQPN